jgi:glycerol-3-phosphate dehydrogenase
VQGRVYDLAIIGGGITGSAIARDAAGRGLSVFLCDEGDLGGGSSSTGGKMVHGRLAAVAGLRLGAMREAIAERETLLHAAPHLTRAVQFIIPHHARLVPPRTLRFGLRVFDHAARNSLPVSRRFNLDDEAAMGLGLQPSFQLAFGTYDCLVDDARLVILNALDARARGASINPRVRCTVAERDAGRWRLSLDSTITDERFTVTAAVLINAAGGQAGEVANHIVESGRRLAVERRTATTIVIRRPHDRRAGYALPAADGRVVYLAPYLPGLMIAGEAVAAETGEAEEGDDGVDYLADVIAQYLSIPARGFEIAEVLRSTWARPAGERQAGGSPMSIDAPPHLAPAITVFGGALFAHRLIAEEAVDQLARFGYSGRPWTARAALPGGGFPRDEINDLARALMAAYPFVGEAHARRLVQAYGTRATAVVTGARRAEDLGRVFGADLSEAEVRFLRQEEWAVTASDILWRRSKLGYGFAQEEIDRLSEYMAAEPHPANA